MFRRLLPTLAAVALLSSCSAAEETTSPPGRTQTQACPPQLASDASGITKERANLLVGLTAEAAENCATDLGWAYRIGSRDGEQFAVTMDYSPNRVTVSIESNVIISVVVG